MTKQVKDPNGKTFSIKIDPELDFLVPFLYKARQFGIPIWRVRTINGYRVPEDRSINQYAAISPKGNRFDIRINKSPGRLKSVITGCQYEMILLSFAHELTHILYWEHTPDRFILEGRLVAAFTKMAKRKGYKGY